MHNARKLNLDALEVEAFETTEGPQLAAKGVFAQSILPDSAAGSTCDTCVFSCDPDKESCGYGCEPQLTHIETCNCTYDTRETCLISCHNTQCQLPETCWC
jgi:hypothetical protein